MDTTTTTLINEQKKKKKSGKSKVNVSEFLEARKFTICTSGDMFELLSGALYSNNVKAIVRELSTNASDAHIEAGNNEPFDVHLPTADDPYFWIRDYGVGLSNEDVREVWCEYFNSTKKQKKELTGKFGLGSKSPLSYVQSFSLVSWYNGYKTRWIVRLNEQKIPEILEEATPEKTDEPNGVKIRFAVPSRDFDAFESAALEVYAYFDRMPRLVGPASGLVLERPQYFVQQQSDAFNWGIRKEFVGPSSPSQVIMSGVAYPLDKKEVPPKYAKGIDLYVEPDTFLITPSRESLRYTSETKETLKVLLKSVESQLPDKVVEAYKKLKCPPLEKHIWYKNSIPEGELFGAARKAVAAILNKQSAAWNLKKGTCVYVHPIEPYSDATISPEFPREQRKAAPADKDVKDEAFTLQRVMFPQTRGTYGSAVTFWYKAEKVSGFVLYKNPDVVIMDKGHNVPSVLLYNYKTAYSISKEALYTVWPVKGSDDPELKAVMQQLGILGVRPVLFSSLEKPPKGEGPSKRKSKSLNSWSTQLSNQEKKDRSEVRGCYCSEREGIYLPLKNKAELEGRKYVVKLCGKVDMMRSTGWEFTDLNRLLPWFGFEAARNDEVVFVRDQFYGEYPQFKSFEEYVKELLRTVPASYDMGIFLQRYARSQFGYLVDTLKGVCRGEHWNYSSTGTCCNAEERLRRSDLVFQMELFRDCRRLKGETFPDYIDRTDEMYKSLHKLLHVRKPEMRYSSYYDRKPRVEFTYVDDLAKEESSLVKKRMDDFILKNLSLFSRDVGLRHYLGLPVEESFEDSFEGCLDTYFSNK